MKTIIAGSRDIINYNLVLHAIEEAKKFANIIPTKIISGCARGVDELGIWYAEDNNLPIEYYRVTPKEWQTIGKGAGPLRNRKMAENAEALIAIWDGKSPGTKNMINTAKELGLKTYVYIV